MSHYWVTAESLPEDYGSVQDKWAKTHEQAHQVNNRLRKEIRQNNFSKLHGTDKSKRETNTASSFYESHDQTNSTFREKLKRERETEWVRANILCVFVYQELRGAKHVKSERLNPWLMYSELTMDSWTLDAGEDAQVGWQPGGI